MEKRQGKIEEKHMKFAANKAPYATFVIDGKKYNSFDNALVDAHNPDDIVEFEGEVNAKGFWELKTMKKIDEPEGATGTAQFFNEETIKKATTKEFHLSPEEVKCRALTSALVFVNDQKLKASREQIVGFAHYFVEWIRDGK